MILTGKQVPPASNPGARMPWCLGGIGLADLRFIRSGDALRIALIDGSGGVTINGYFNAWDAPAAGSGSELFELLANEVLPPNSLLEPAILAALPRVPLSSIQFSSGDTFDLVAVLDSTLELSDATLLGTEGDDELLRVPPVTISSMLSAGMISLRMSAVTMSSSPAPATTASWWGLTA